MLCTQYLSTVYQVQVCLAVKFVMGFDILWLNMQEKFIQYYIICFIYWPIVMHVYKNCACE